MTIYVLVFIISFLLIARSGAALVGSLTNLAKFFGMSEYAIAFILMSFATSIPELFIGISSTLQNASALSLGNILGANLINITLVIGLVAFFSHGIKIDSKVSRENFWIISFLAFLPIFLISDGVISRGDGVVLLFSFFAYLWRLMGEKEHFSKVISDFSFTSKGVGEVFRAMKLFIFGIFILIFSSFLLVWSGKFLIAGFNMDPIFFGMIFIALGTALPELTFGIKASLMGHKSMTLGNSLGSIAFNASFILGVMSLIRPIHFTLGAGFVLVSAFLFIGFVLFNIFAYTNSAISKIEGAMLILLYIAFIGLQYFV